MQVSRPPQQQIKQPLQQESQQQSALQGYINLNLQKGYSEGQLREALLKQGWKKELIDINIKPAEEFGKVDITIKSVNKIKNIHPNWIKILEVVE